MNDRLVVTGFDSHGDLDRFVRSEIRYFRSRDMRACRSEAPGGAVALVLAFRDGPDLRGTAAALSRLHPGLVLSWSREEKGRTVAFVFEAGKEATTRHPPEPEGGWHEIEEIYSTF